MRCDLCNKKIDKIGYGKNTRNNGQKFVCYRCYKQEKQRQKLLNPKQVGGYRKIMNYKQVKNEKMPFFVCEFCKQRFRDSKGLKIHIKREHKSKSSLKERLKVLLG